MVEDVSGSLMKAFAVIYSNSRIRETRIRMQQDTTLYVNSNTVQIRRMPLTNQYLSLSVAQDSTPTEQISHQ